MKYRRYNKPYTPRYKRVLSDQQVLAACQLRGVNPNDFLRVIFCVIPEAFGMRLLRYYVLKSSLGTEYGRWEIG